MAEKTRFYPTQPGQMPRQPHWAIITGSTHTGSYGDTEHHLEYVAYLDKAEWEAEINRREQERGYLSRDYVAVEVRPASVVREIKIT